MRKCELPHSHQSRTLAIVFSLLEFLVFGLAVNSFICLLFSCIDARSRQPSQIE